LYANGNVCTYIDTNGKTATSNAEFLYEFIVGKEPRQRIYTGTDFRTQELARSTAGENLRNAFYSSSGHPSGVSYGTGAAFFDTFVLASLNSVPIVNYFVPNNNTLGNTALQVGGYGGAYADNNYNGTVTYTIPNTAGRYSFLYHGASNVSSKTGPMSNINQSFTWTEQINWSKTSNLMYQAQLNHYKEMQMMDIATNRRWGLSGFSLGLK